MRGFQGCYLDNHRNNWRCGPRCAKTPPITLELLFKSVRKHTQWQKPIQLLPICMHAHTVAPTPIHDLEAKEISVLWTMCSLWANEVPRDKKRKKDGAKFPSGPSANQNFSSASFGDSAPPGGGGGAVFPELCELKNCPTDPMAAAPPHHSSVAGPLASPLSLFVTERCLWSCRPLPSRVSSCV